MNLYELMKKLWNQDNLMFVGDKISSRIHETKSGAGRSKGMKRKNHVSGIKIARQAFEGICTLRNGVGAAGRLALEGKPRVK